MKYLLDTCTLSEPLKKKPDERVIQWLNECDQDDLFISVMTLGEIQKGISKISNTVRKRQFQLWFDTDLRKQFQDRILPIDAEIATTWGIITGIAETHGIKIPIADGLIGATAITFNMTVVTRNESDMKRTGAAVLNVW